MENENLTTENNTKKRTKIKWSFLTIVLLVIITQLVFSSFRNFHKNFNFGHKIKKMEQVRTDEYNKYLKLKSEVENFNSEKNSEAIARNNLKMAEDDEVLIIINNKKK